MKIPSSNGLFFYLTRLFNFCCFFLLIFLLHFYSNPFPYSDEWNFLPQAIGVEPLTWDWVWAQHSDHRIPIQKIFQVSLLRLTGYDFGLLILANTILIFLTTSLLISAVRIYRESSQVGDLIIPLILMNPGFGPFIWSFHFEFMSSTLLSLIFLAFFLQKNTPSCNTSYIMGSICILLMAFCGMNGVVPSIIISLLFLLYMLWARPISNKFVLYIILIILVLALMVSLIIISSWNPSGVTTLSSTVFLKKIYNITDNFYYLINPRPIIMFEKQKIYFVVNSVLYIVALGFLAKRIWESYQIYRSFFIDDIAVLVTLIASFSIQLNIAIGRAEYWSPGLEMHYGYLATVLPIVTWIAVSVYVPRKMGIIIGLVLVLLYGYLYVENLQWRMIYAKENRQKVLDVNKDILNGMKISDFVKRYNHIFYYVDNDDTRQIVKSAIIILKNSNVEPYAHLQLD